MAKPIISYGDKDLPEIEGRAEQAHLPPTSYLRKKPGTENEVEPVEGRRPSKLLLVNRLREEVGTWRQNYDGASEVTKRLFTHWFDEDHLVDERIFRFYFGQREAMETLAYLVEVRRMLDSKDLVEAFGEVFYPERTQRTLGTEIGHQTTMDGVRQIRRWVPEFDRESVQDLPAENLGRFAFKMATGSGKTVVMAMAIVWSYFHREFEQDSSMSQNFLLIAPNVIVFQRLAKDFANLEIFRNLPLVPPEWESHFNLKVIQRGEGSEADASRNLFLTNIHQLYESTTEEQDPVNAVEVLLGRKPSKSLSQDRPMLERLRGLEDLIVLNDEAHHVHDEDKEWNKSLMSLHQSLPQGLDLWLDFSATPKDQNGTYFPWVICDYPLAQAVEDRIVKSPIIVHQVDQEDPVEVKEDNVIDAYGPWITAALSRWREHNKVYSKHGIRPVLFVMAEKNTFADRIGEWLATNKDLKLKREEVLIIHTDSKGEIKETSKKEVEKAREAARDIDAPSNKIKVIVSVMMLREGWDVRNVTVVLGLRPFTAKAGILPEQAVGRGLRLMTDLGPDRTQTLEVLGTREFEKFVKLLEAEGVGIKTVVKPPKPPMAIEPIAEKKTLDIVIPLTKPVFAREYRRLAELDAMTLDPIFEREELPEQKQIDLRFKFAHLDVEVGQATVDAGSARLVEEVLADITNRVIVLAGLTASFAELYPTVRDYVQKRCFGRVVNIESEDVREALRSFDVRDAIARYLARQIGTLTATRKEMEFENPKFRLSQTKPFYWRRDLPLMTSKKTIFNLVATYNGFERRFATFLDGAADVKRFASLGVTGQEAWTKFRVDYLKPSGATGWYYPDWVVVQADSKKEVNWIIETKGRVWEGTEAKDAAIQHWCERVSILSGKPWRFKRVNQTEFELADPANFAELTGIASGSPTPFPADLEELSDLYLLAAPDELTTFIEANAQLGPLLKEAHEEIIARFGPETKMRLEVFVDPEDQDERQLLLVIETQTEDAVSILGDLDQEWWLAQLPRSQNQLIITVESH